ncbi:hypothetical protein PRZ48_010124 [Zasmidium cellare]|uniref:DUF7580 domain-containing protein n=1 Tax=Zasmidium cellare TaxID=395010 RepID=A0ABR0EDN2_ZASCE|nr:hypothetical protein PRZ48_010124 [Zasmidium cellare]
MSGIEVAGIVLAVIPLIITGIEVYDRKIKRRRNVLEELEDLKDELDSEYRKFRNTMELLLGDSVDDHTFNQLFSNIGGKLWSNARVEECLRNRLRQDYEIFLKYVTRMNSSVEDLQKSFPVDLEKHTISGSVKRLTIVFKFKDYWSIVNRIERSNSKMEALLTGSITLEPVRQSRQKYPDFDQVSGNASSIFKAVTENLSTSCINDHMISASLRSIVGPAQKAISFSNEHEDSMVRVLVQHHTSRLPSTTGFKPVAEADIRPWSTKDTNGPLVLRSHIREIQDLCQSLNEGKNSEPCVGLLTASQALLEPQRQYAVYRPLKPFFSQHSGASTSTLSSLLLRKPKLKMSEPAKRQMAVRLAQGLIQLSGTPWMHSRFSRNDITLLRTPAGVAADFPFITASSKALQVNGTYDLVRGIQRRVLIQNDLLFALGILLIEIWLERPIDHLHRPEELGKDGKKDDLADFYAACRLEDRIYADAGTRYGDVVRRCIRCQFARPQPDLTDPLFRKEVYDGVVAELEAGLDVVRR